MALNFLNFALRRAVSGVTNGARMIITQRMQSGASARSSLLETLDDSDDDFGGFPPFRSSPAQAPLPQEVPASDADSYLQPSHAGLPAPKPADATGPSTASSTEASTWSREPSEGTSAEAPLTWRHAADLFSNVSQLGGQTQQPAASLLVADSVRHIFQGVRQVEVVRAL